jgi:signal transduction histidine kinase
VQANKTLQSTSDNQAITLANMVNVNNEDLPLIATDDQGRIIDYRNLGKQQEAGDSAWLQRRLEVLASENDPIEWQVSDSPRIAYKVYYGNSKLLTEVEYYPFAQLLVMALFLVILIYLITVQNKSTQNQVWAGMAKETAHQMGTPITSLKGWVELLKEKEPQSEIIDELEKDVARLKLVSDRFGKIGSQPQLEPTDLNLLVQEMVGYMKKRAPGKVVFACETPEKPLVAKVSPTLINWVLENLLKNALDAMEGQGQIGVTLQENGGKVVLDVSDTGKGIAAAQIARVFEPGFTTKKRGWGLGLTLSKRIVEQYHKGELVVKHSEPGKGTTFRMTLPL